MKIKTPRSVRLARLQRRFKEAETLLIAAEREYRRQAERWNNLRLRIMREQK